MKRTKGGILPSKCWAGLLPSYHEDLTTSSQPIREISMHFYMGYPYMSDAKDALGRGWEPDVSRASLRELRCVGASC